MHLMSYGLFTFIAVSEKMPFRNSLKKTHLAAMPNFLSIVSFLIAYCSRPYFWINADNELNILYFPFMFIVPGSYMVFSFVFSVQNALRSTNKEEKKRYLLIGSIPLGVIAFGMIQVVMLNAPTLCFGSTIMWLWFYIQNTQAMVSVDDLTNLNNRRQINRYMEQLHFSPDTSVYIMMMDINRFKKINDTYGHAEGDRALIFVSDALRQACDQIRASVFLGRYGGDEFTVIIQDPEKQIRPEEICEIFHRTIDEKSRETSLPYLPDISIGYDRLRDETDTASACLQRADQNLYIDKKAQRKAR